MHSASTAISFCSNISSLANLQTNNHMYGGHLAKGVLRPTITRGFKFAYVMDGADPPKDLTFVRTQLTYSLMPPPG